MPSSRRPHDRDPAGRRRGAAALLLAAVLLATGCGPREPSGGLSAEDRAALERLGRSDAPLVLSRNWEGLAARFAEDAVRMPPGAPAIQGRAAIRAALEGMPPMSAFSFRVTSLEGHGRLATMRAAWSYTLVPPDGEPIEDAGTILIAFEKQADGTWLRIADAWNSDGGR